MDEVRTKQQRPSVLWKVTQAESRRQNVHPESRAARSTCKEEEDGGNLPQPSPPSRVSSPRPSRPLLPVRTDGLHASIEARLHDGISDWSRVLFVSGLCRWPGCNAVTEDFSAFLKHLHSEHGHGDRSIAQWRVQQDIVQYMETQLILEKQKLVAMQLHLSDRKYSDLKAAPQWPHGLPVFLALPAATDGDRVQQWSIKHLEEWSQHSYRAAGSAHLLPDLGPSIDCYKLNNIRPPYTYAFLIRWSILESPDKQRTLNEIYNWFTTMFFYFRHNTATWKNAVRHNLSLHKCFVRVEGGKGAVWTVDEREYQRRKGQKYHRDGPVKWLSSSHYCPEDA
ncbi:forkhead box protein P1 [Embiotoca jacksoni]|uniref:forkhead box protein P1 n=1 Tax=Embiotoca jacksoni TaxID=100190 RepID=UPI00370487B4